MKGRVSKPGDAEEFDMAQSIATRRGSVDKLNHNGIVWERDLKVDRRVRGHLLWRPYWSFFVRPKDAFRRYQMLSVAVIARYNELASCGEVPDVGGVGHAISSSKWRQTVRGREE